jgi:signal transduction histidine kinase
LTDASGENPLLEAEERAMNRVLHHLAGQSQTRLLVYALFQVLLLGVIDYITGPEWFFSIFYTVPVSMMAWFAGRRHGIAASMMAATSWLLDDLFAGYVYSNPTIPFCNAGVRLGFFLIITFTLAELRESRARQDEFSHFIVHDLRSPVSVVVTGLETLRDLSDRELSAQQQELIDLCLASCNRTLTLINSILDLPGWKAARCRSSPARSMSSNCCNRRPTPCACGPSCAKSG